MPRTALVALKEVLDSHSEVTALLTTAMQSIYFGRAPRNVSISSGAVIIIEHRGEEWDRTTETRMRTLTAAVLAFHKDFDVLDQQLVPAIIDALDDQELALSIDDAQAYNLEVTNITMGPEEYEDEQGNLAFGATIDIRLEYQQSRRVSNNAFTN